MADANDLRRLHRYNRTEMKWLRHLWRDIVNYVNQEPQIILELRELSDKANKYERLKRYYPNILARLNAAADRKESNNMIKVLH